MKIIQLFQDEVDYDGVDVDDVGGGHAVRVLQRPGGYRGGISVSKDC